MVNWGRAVGVLQGLKKLIKKYAKDITNTSSKYIHTYIHADREWVEEKEKTQTKQQGGEVQERI